MARRHSFLQDNLTMIAMAALAVGFVLWQRKEKTNAVIQGVVGVSRPPPRPRDRERNAVILAWLQAQQSKGR
jgi:hypothetical protein